MTREEIIENYILDKDLCKMIKENNASEPLPSALVLENEKIVGFIASGKLVWHLPTFRCSYHQQWLLNKLAFNMLTTTDFYLREEAIIEQYNISIIEGTYSDSYLEVVDFEPVIEDDFSSILDEYDMEMSKEKHLSKL